MSAPAILESRYRLDERIAAGGMGEVWRGTDLVLERRVAIKLLRPAYAHDEAGLVRFRAEAKYAGSLSHPNIAQIFDYGGGEPPAQPYLVMELVDGPSLAGLLADGPLEPGRTMDIISQAAAGLQAAHAAGLVHRDIKPGNLLVGHGGRVKIADFGIAHAMGSAPVTRTGELVGTPAYLAPEQVTGRAATPAADLYALGIVAYQCLTGEVPFTGEPLAVAIAHQEADLPRLPRSVPPQVAALVAQLTAKDPRARPASAGEVARRADRLRAALTGEAPTHPGLPGPGRRAIAVTMQDLSGDGFAGRAPAGPAGAGQTGQVPAGSGPADGTGQRYGWLDRGAGWPDDGDGWPDGTDDWPDSGEDPWAEGRNGGRRWLALPGGLTLPDGLAARAGLAAAAIVVFGLAGWAVAGLPGAGAPQRHAAPPASSRPASPAIGGVNPSGSPDPQTVATPGPEGSRPGGQHRTPSPSASAPASSAPPPTPTPPAPSPSGSATPSSPPPTPQPSPSPPTPAPTATAGTLSS